LGVEGRQAPRGAPLIEDLDHPLHRGLRISDGALRAASPRYYASTSCGGPLSP